MYNNDPFYHINTISEALDVFPNNVMQVLDNFVQEITERLEIMYNDESYDLDTLGDVIDHETINNIGDAIAEQLFDNISTTQLVALTLSHIPEGEILHLPYVSDVLCDAVVDAEDYDDDVYSRAAQKAVEDTRWGAVVEIDKDFSVEVLFNNKQ